MLAHHRSANPAIRIARIGAAGCALLLAACVAGPTTGPSGSLVPATFVTAAPGATEDTRATNSPAPGATESAGPITWMPGPAVSGGGSVQVLDAGRGGLVAAGETEDGVPVIWGSPDASTWTVGSGTSTGHPWAFELSRPLGVGVGCTRCSADGDPIEAAVWTSVDRLTWQVHALGEQGAVIDDVIAGPGGFVAVGRSDVSLDGPCGTLSVWRSADGSTWSAAKPLERNACGARLVHDPRPAHGLVVLSKSIWRSPDGRDWTRVGSRPGDPSDTSQQIVSTPQRLVVMGQTCTTPTNEAVATCRAEAWASADGSAWTAAGDRPAFDGFVVHDIAAFGELIVAVGTNPDDLDSIVLTSRDGLTWQRSVLSTGHHGLYAVAGLGDRIYAVEYAGNVWTGVAR